MSSTVQFNESSINPKELPHNIEAEQGLLGAILLNDEIFYDISEIINIEHFSLQMLSVAFLSFLMNLYQDFFLFVDM